MENDARLKPYEKTEFFADGASARPPVAGTVPRGHENEDSHLYTGKVNGRFVRSFPFAIDEKVLARGRERYDIYCAACHNNTGTGDGMIVRRGFKKAASYFDQRLRDVPEGYLFYVITNGFGDMPRFSPELTPEDRWAVIAYIRALQSSRNVPVGDLTPEEKAKLPDDRQKAPEGHR